MKTSVKTPWSDLVEIVAAWPAIERENKKAAAGSDSQALPAAAQHKPTRLSLRRNRENTP